MTQTSQITKNAIAKIMAEKRIATRVKSTFSASIFCEGEFETHCVIKDVSESGMRLELAEKVSLPDEFDVRTTVMAETMSVRQVWEKYNSIGVEFISIEEGNSDDNVQALAS
ncbi:MAG: PilZ domain-containing protein [Pseudomonadota bacterium]